MELPAWITSLPIAHRGLHDNNVAVPENSLAAFQAGRSAGFALELDVHLGADGTVIVHHDFTLERLSGEDRRITSLRRADLPQVTLAGSDETIPTLDDVFALVSGEVPVLVEVKVSRDPQLAAMNVANLLRVYDGPAAVQSFDPRVVHWFSRHAPEVPCGQLAGGGEPSWWKQQLLDRMVTNRWARPGFVGFNVDKLPHRTVSHLRRTGLPVLAWTVRTGTQLRHAAEHADNVIFERWNAEDPVEVASPST